MLPYERRLKPNSRALRSTMTEAEQKLWYRLRRKQINGWQFYRQKPLGPYIVDFYCPAASLVVEVDGSQHFEAEHVQTDQARDQYLDGLGLRVLRFDNRQVLLETDAVVEVIGQISPGSRQIPPSPPFSKGGAELRADEVPAFKQGATVLVSLLEKATIAPFSPFENGTHEPISPFENKVSEQDIPLEKDASERVPPLKKEVSEPVPPFEKVASAPIFFFEKEAPESIPPFGKGGPGGICPDSSSPEDEVEA